MPVSAVIAKSYEADEVRAALLSAFGLLGMDPSNPFKTLVKPGDRVFVKPNWVSHRYRESCLYQHDVFTTITHPAVIREVVRFIDLALAGKGRILIGDNPSIDADFQQLMNIQQLNSLKEEIKTPLDILDLRPLVCRDLKDYGYRSRMQLQTGDPHGETTINLGRRSKLYGLNPRLFRGVFNERAETVRAHSRETQLYSFSNAIFQSDVFISVPKMKTHHKCGVTLNLKGLVGTIGRKNYLVHWREGFPAIGGDAYPNFWTWFADRFKKVKKRGAWSGNDTIWRMVVDLYQGIQQGPKRRFSIVDGILGGEGNGPFCPEPKLAQTLVVGTDFVETDLVATRLMGFDTSRIPYLKYFLDRGDYSWKNISFFSDFIEPSDLHELDRVNFGFKPPTHWQGLIRGKEN